jgi:hypothetical protein
MFHTPIAYDLKTKIIILKKAIDSWVTADRILFRIKQQPQSNDEDVRSWCIVQGSNMVFRAQIQHVGRGRFKIVNDNQESIHVGEIIDASEVINVEK